MLESDEDLQIFIAEAVAKDTFLHLVILVRRLYFDTASEILDEVVEPKAGLMKRLWEFVRRPTTTQQK